jgi:hypothetical protein
MRNVDDLVSMSAACRERVNPYLFNYALSVAILHRPDTRNLQVPPLFESFPGKFVDGAIFNRARKESEIFLSGSRVCTYQLYTDLESYICTREMGHGMHIHVRPPNVVNVSASFHCCYEV